MKYLFTYIILMIFTLLNSAVAKEILSENTIKYIQEQKEISNQEANWNTTLYGTSGVSTFSFLDKNENGIYDIGDTPLSDITYIILDEKHNVISQRSSNLDGYTNFYAASGKYDDKTNPEPGIYNIKGDITKTGKYYIYIIIPDEFTLTTNNQMQEINIIDTLGSVGDISSQEAPSVIGFKRNTYISGHDENLIGKNIFLYDNNKKKTIIKVDDYGSWKVSTSQGQHTIDYGNGALKEINVDTFPVHTNNNRSIVKDHLFTVNFDDLIKGEKSIIRIPNGYHNLNWNNWVITHSVFYGGYGYRNGTTSARYVAYMSSGSPSTISSHDGKPFNFIGGHFTISSRDAEGEVIKINAYKNGQLKYSDSIKLTRYGPIYLDANYENIDYIKIYTKHHWQALIDDMYFSFN